MATEAPSPASEARTATERSMIRSPSLLVLALLAIAPAAPAQRGSRPVAPPARPSGVQPAVQSAPPAPFTGTPRGAAMASGAERPVVLLTGYWPPTNEGVRRFSPKPALNPGGWIGEDWNGRGYDVVSFFPTFTNPDCSNCGRGTGDLEVDYQDTALDFELIVERYRPIAIITFSRGFVGNSWEVEMNQFNRGNWINDYDAPRQPTPAPPDSTIDRNALRISSLPVEDIVDRIAASGLPLAPEICYSGSGGGFLSEFIAYLGVAYQGNHADPASPDWCIAAGHVHVGTAVDWATCEAAVELTLEAVIDRVDDVLGCAPMLPYCPGAPNSDYREATLSALGPPSVAANNLEIVVQRAPDSTTGLLFYGASPATLSLGDGLLCVAQPQVRLPDVAQATSRGLLRFPLDLSASPLSSVAVGGTVHFQAWYRDAAGISGSNTSSALTVTLCP